MRRSIVVGAATLALTIMIPASALATECFNASKKYQNSGAQVVLGANDEILYITTGLQNRIEQGLVDPDSGEGFHGLIAFDFDSDGLADGGTWFGVGPDGEEIPLEAQFLGPACRGLTNIGIYFEQCVGT